MGSRDRRTLLVGVSVVVTIVGLGRGIPAIHEWEARARVSAAKAAADRAAATRAVGAGERVREHSQRTSSELAARDSGLLHAASPAEAASELAMLMNAIADSAGVKLGSMSVRSDSAFVHGFAVAIVRSSATADVDGLMSFLREVEGGAVTLVVRELTITQPEPAAPDGKPDALRFEIVVHALVRQRDDSAVTSRRGGA